jgi:hypothetical protein
MDRNAFNASPAVIAFTTWLADRGRTLSICLNIKSSRFVPGGIRAELTGLNALLPHYRWRTPDSKKGDWDETRQCLRALGDALKRAIADRKEDEVLEACGRILAWGGNRNSRTGAWPYLSGLHEQGKLAEYLDAARRAFALDGALIDESRPQAAKMNSMLTKVHALASADGLPIYDSRVAAAIAALVESWRRDTGRTGDPLPRELVFPATTADRSVLCLFGDAQSPGVMSYASHAADETAASWSAAKIRLGWLMSEVLEQAEWLFRAEDARYRMHAFEASLFMIGYDVACLRGNQAAAEPGKTRRAKVQRAGSEQLRREHADFEHKTISTLNGDKQNLKYAGNLAAGFSGIWNETDFSFASDFLHELLADFPAKTEVGLGASMTGDVKEDTLGYWIDAHYPAKPRRYASALAAIFVAEGLAERIAAPGPIRLLFL